MGDPRLASVTLLDALPARAMVTSVNLMRDSCVNPNRMRTDGDRRDYQTPVENLCFAGVFKSVWPLETARFLDQHRRISVPYLSGELWARIGEPPFSLRR